MKSSIQLLGYHDFGNLHHVPLISAAKKKSHSIKELDRLNIEGKLITRRTELQEVPWK